MKIYRFWMEDGDENTTPPLEPWLGEVIRNLHPHDELVELDATFLTDRERYMLHGAVKDIDTPRHFANYVRWKALSIEGGIWLDHDVIPTVNLTAFPTSFTASYGTHRTACVVRVHPDDVGFAKEMVERIWNVRSHEYVGSCVDVSGDNVVNALCPAHFESWKLPFSSDGQRISRDMWAIHTWDTSSKRKLAHNVLDS